jgi:hypothetical protein
LPHFGANYSASLSTNQLYHWPQNGAFRTEKINLNAFSITYIRLKNLMMETGIIPSPQQVGHISYCYVISGMKSIINYLRDMTPRNMIINIWT